MAERQVKSKERVAAHGEVFTAQREVNAMCDLVASECLRIDSRFLEPACGDGNFLAEILRRKLDTVTRQYKRSAYDWEKNAILALGSLYGVDIQADNCGECRRRLFALWDERYRKAVKKAEQNEDVRASVRYILERNIICGDALSLHCVDERGDPTGEPIVFSQWSFATGPMIKREDYTFEELLTESEQMTLDLSPGARNDGEGTLIRNYEPIHYRRLKEYG